MSKRIIVKSAAQIALEKTTPIMPNEPPVTSLDSDREKLIAAEAEILKLKIKLGLVKIDPDFTVTKTDVLPKAAELDFSRPVFSTYRLERELIIDPNNPRTYRAKAETRPVEQFEKTPVQAKAETKRDQPLAGREAFATTFRNAVSEAFDYLRTKNVASETFHTVNAEDPTSTKYRVYFTITRHPNYITLERKSKNPRKAFTVNIPTPGGLLERALIPAYAPKQ